MFADGFILEWNTPYHSLNLNGSITCNSFVQNYEWNTQVFANITRQSVCLDSKLSDNSFSDSLNKRNANPVVSHYFGLHNLYGYQHTKMVSLEELMIIFGDF